MPTGRSCGIIGRMRSALPLLLALLALSARAEPPAAFELKGGAKAEESLRRFIGSDPAVQARLADASARSQAMTEELRSSDLRDALAEGRPEVVEQPPADASGEERAAFLEGLPGMRALPGSACRSLADCATPEMSVEVTEGRWLPDALRRLIRPWMLLQRARRSSLELSPRAEGDAVLAMKLRGIDAPPMTLQVTPSPLGGFTVGFARPEGLADLYARERAAALKR